MARNKNRNKLHKVILITGATGFIGRRVINKISTAYPQAKIICLVRNITNNLETSGRKIINRLGHNSIEVDLATGFGLDKIPKNPNIVIHLAANTETADIDHRVNDKGVINLYHALRPISKQMHFIHVSTAAFMAGRPDCSKPFTEKSTPSPTNLYGRSKLKGELFIRERSLNDGFRLTILRLPTVYGSGSRSNSMFDYIKKEALKNSLMIRLNWPGITSLVSVDDVADFTIAAMKNPAKSKNPAIYVVTTESMAFSQIVKLVFKNLNLQYRPINLPVWLWKIIASFRTLIYALEKLIPATIYNLLWRSTLIADNVLYSENVKADHLLPNWKPKQLASEIKKVI